MTKEEALSYWATHKLSFQRYHFGKGKKTLPWLDIVCGEHYLCCPVVNICCECPGQNWCGRCNYPKWMRLRNRLIIKYRIERDKISYLLLKRKRK